MIEIKAKLARADSGIYATGECVECLIEFTNRNAEEGESINNRQEERLAWASAQLHCYRKTSYSFSKTPAAADIAGRTALNAVAVAQGDIIIATKPKILFCDLKLVLGETKTYLFDEFVPRDGPPTYRGHDIKYFYKITIATQRVMSKVQVLTLPIRVLPIPVILRTDELPCTEETNDELAPTNPFLEKREISELEVSWHHLKNLTARRAPKSYRISNKRGFVGRFCLFKPCYKIGEDVVGSLDFSNCKVRCVQFSVKLQSQEISLHANNNNASATATANAATGDAIDSGSLNSLDMASVVASVASGNTVIDQLQRTKSGAGTAGATGKHSADDDDEESAGRVTTYATSHQVCYCMLQTQVVIPIPLHVTPSFHTNLVEVRWRLHFEFVTSTLMDFGERQTQDGELQAPAELHVETMVWNLPLKLYAANPLQIYAPSQTHNLLIK